MKSVAELKDEEPMEIKGYEQLVDELVVNKAQLDVLEDAIAEAKATLRKAATAAVAATPGVRSVTFVGSSGQRGVVSLPNPTATSSRITIRDDLAEELCHVLPINELCTVRRTATLSGAWFDWLESVRTAWAKQGVIEPNDGLVVTATRALTEEGVARLHQYTAAGGPAGEAASQLLSSGLRSPTVTVRAAPKSKRKG